MTALLLVDIQVGMDDPKWGQRNNPGMELVCADLLHDWRRRQWPVFHIRHDSTEVDSPLRPDRAGNRIKDVVRPCAGERVIGKQVNGAFIGTDLHEQLCAKHIRRVVIVGLTTPHCVSTTARMAGNLGYDTFVVSDATAAFPWPAHDGTVVPAEAMHFYALAALHGEFATVVDSAGMRQIMK